MLSLTLLATLVFTSANIIGHNVNYNGPFNTNIQPSHPRRLTGTTQSGEFYHGVASGDPSDVDLLIWSRVTPPFQDEYAMDIDIDTADLEDLKMEYETMIVSWAMATSESKLNFDCDDNMCGTVDTNADIDYTVKYLVENLSPNTWYYYQFQIGDTQSQVGKTRTLPSSDDSIDSVRLAFGSCKQIPWGFFNNLRDIAAKEDLDYMVWLGDYIYEFPTTSVVNGTSIGRIPFPNNYLYNLSHYRGRYLQHRLDADVQVIHRALPFIMVWDDHEVVNDHWVDGAPDRWQDDTLFGVNFLKRKANGHQAYFEWNPVRSVDVSARGGLYNSYKFGELFDLIVIDAQSQRTEPAADMLTAADLDPSVHYLFPETQREWIIDQLTQSTAKWRILGTDNYFGASAQFENGSYVFGEPFGGTDRCEGYPQERQMILDAINDNDITNIISVAGGPHTGIAQKVYSTGRPIKNDPDSFPLFAEFALDAIAAPKLFEEFDYLPYVDDYAAEWSWVSPYFRLLRDGYMIMDISPERAKAQYWVNGNIQDSTTESVLDATFCVYDNEVEFSECMTATTSEPVSTSTAGESDDSDNYRARAIFVCPHFLLFFVYIFL